MLHSTNHLRASLKKKTSEMAGLKRAKKFRQKHLPKKLENVKKARKLADKYGKRTTKSLKPAASAKAEQTRDFDVPAQELFNDADLKNKSNSNANSDADSDSDAEAEAKSSIEGGDLMQYISDDDEDAKAEEQAYLAEDVEIDLTVIKKWRKQLVRKSDTLPTVLTAIHTRSETTNRDIEQQLSDLLLEVVPKALETHFTPTNAPTHPVQKQLTEAVLPLLSSADGSVLVRAISLASSVLPLVSEREQKQLAKALASVVVRMSTSDDARLAAFDAMKQASLLNDKTRALFAKQGYKALVRVSARTNTHTLPTINLAKNLFATLFETSEVVTPVYDLAFSEIRQLALHLKSALDRTKNPGYDLQVCCTWPFVHSLDFWSRVLSTASPLQPLIHPLCQVTLRTSTLVTTVQYIPMRLHLVQSLIRLSRHTQVYIPLSPVLLDTVMETSCFQKQAKPSTLQRPDLESLLHVPTMYLNTSVYQSTAVSAFVDLMVDNLCLYSKHIAFPELVAPILARLRKFARKNTLSVVSKPLVELCQRLEANSAYILKQRANVNFGPKDTNNIAKFLQDVDWQNTPLGKEAVARAKVREIQRQLMREQAEAAKAEQDDQDEQDSSDDDSGSDEAEMEDENENENENENEYENEDEEEME